MPSPPASPNKHHANVRALAKAISWRLLGTAGTSAIVLFFTGRWGLALSVGGVEGLAKIGLYFIHERLWDRVTFGRHHAAGPASAERVDAETPPPPK